MFRNILNSFSFHKVGLKALKLVHKADSSTIPLFMLNSLIKSLYPYINIFLSAAIIDTIITKDFDLTITFIIALIAGNFIVGVISDALKQSCEGKSIKVHQHVQLLISKQALELDYETLEVPKTLESIHTAGFSMQHGGGFGMFITNYGLLLESLISIFTGIIMVFSLCLSVPNSESAFLNIASSIPVSFIILFAFFLIISYTNISLAKHLNERQLVLFERQMKTEKRFSYFFNQIILNFARGTFIRIFNMTPMIEKEEYARTTFSSNTLWPEMFSLLRKKEYTESLIGGFSIFFAYTFVILKVLANAISIGALTKYIGSISLLNSALSSFIKFNEELRLQCDYLKYYNEFMDIKNEQYTGTIPIEKRNDNVYEIEFHDVSFSYPGQSEKVLDHVSCKLSLKNKMAVVGRNGAGKTTFIKLLCRLYDPADGYISLNGVDIRKYNYLEYLSLFAVVFQDFNLFAFPLDQNIASSTIIDEEKIWECIELAGIKDRVKKMPEKLKTPLYKYDKGGVEVSGGEAQKIAIARALYKNAPFVILDEPTAALDPISEYEIYSKFDELVKDKTSIYISHRMSSCRFCDDIIVFDNGSIIQRGSHDKLIEDENNLYANLWNAQAKYYVTNANS
jgi:ABC-type multidrug transport system fused ATPase/permease subunit